MCGIFGIIAVNKKTTIQALSSTTKELFKYSEQRGKDASGLLSVSEREIIVYKSADRAKVMLRSNEFKEVIANAESNYLAGRGYIVTGHTRMVTSGSEDNEGNNQPILKEEFLIMHNGIIVNQEELWQNNQDYQREHEVDTEIFGVLLEKERLSGLSTEEGMREALKKIKGANTLIAFRSDDNELILGSNNGSLYLWSESGSGITVFASEEFVLRQSLKYLVDPIRKLNIQQIGEGHLTAVSMVNGEVRKLNNSETETEAFLAKVGKTARDVRLLSPKKKTSKINTTASKNCTHTEIEKYMQFDEGALKALKRCTKCILPESFPFISFDNNGVCNFCNTYKKKELYGENALRQLAQKAIQMNRNGKCLVPISGGRDSCYGLHYIKNELGLNPVAYTYDWGFVTDLARRNISRMCGELNIEHILVAADLRQKRENVRKNVCAWLQKPELGMIPLFMAGDKHFFYYATKIKEQLNLGPTFFSMNWLEKTGFKSGFAGVNDNKEHEKTHGLTQLNQIKLIKYYLNNFIANPRYINKSILDTLFAYCSFYLKSKDYVQIFDYIPWVESDVVTTIVEKYGWETALDTKSTWRIGDGTAPFYNYIYLTIAGFTESDTFRSNQIRDGLIERGDALELAVEENRPRAESFKHYCMTINIDPIETLKIISSAQKLYAI